MVKVITYGTYDLLHYGHIKLLERAKALGDYLIVGVTADDFDKTRGKINVQQSLMERIEAVRATGLADKIIVEEYEGQKIDDIRRYDVDIFTVGSDWAGKFDYLNEYCKVVYSLRYKLPPDDFQIFCPGMWNLVLHTTFSDACLPYAKNRKCRENVS